MPSQRTLRLSREPTSSTLLKGINESITYAPAVLRLMREGFEYRAHWDSIHATAWLGLRTAVCGTGARLDRSAMVDVRSTEAYLPFRGAYNFSANAILTLRTPPRAQNPADLHVWRVRWPALLHRCDVLRSMEAYGSGVRTTLPSGETYPAGFAPGHAVIRGEPGSLYLFNSEFVHTTPPIQGSDAERVVVGATVGYSSGEASPLEVFT